MLEVEGQEAALGIVAGDAERRLREVVRAEGEEVGVLGQLAGPQRRARQLDHRADLVLEAAFFGDGPCGQLDEQLQLRLRTRRAGA